jgi:hypothetical protein
MTLTAPKRFAVDRKAERVVVWSPPRVTILGVVYSLELVSLEDTTWNPQSEFSMAQPWSQAKLLHEICQVVSKRLYCPRSLISSLPGTSMGRLRSLLSLPNRQVHFRLELVNLCDTSKHEHRITRDYITCVYAPSSIRSNPLRPTPNSAGAKSSPRASCYSLRKVNHTV